MAATEGVPRPPWWKRLVCLFRGHVLPAPLVGEPFECQRCGVGCCVTCWVCKHPGMPLVGSGRGVGEHIVLHDDGTRHSWVTALG